MSKQPILPYDFQLVEVVHVELPYEGGVVAVPEVLGQHPVLEVPDVFNPEAFLLGLPLDD